MNDSPHNFNCISILSSIRAAKILVPPFQTLILIAIFGLYSAPADAQFLEKIKSWFGEDKPASCEQMKSISAYATQWPDACGTGEPPEEIDPRAMELSPYEGQWDVVFEGSDLVADALVIVTKGQGGLGPRDLDAELSSTGILRHAGAAQAGNHWGSVQVEPDGSLREMFGGWGACSCVPLYTYVRPTGDPDVLVGHWIINEEKGATIWRRRPPTTVRSVRVHGGLMSEDGLYIDDYVEYGERPARIERNYPLGCGYGGSRGNCPTVTLSIRGENFVGGHDIWLDPASSMESYGSWECVDGSAFSYEWNRCTTDAPYGRGNAGIQVRLIVWDGVEPGLQVLWIDGQPVPFELIMHGYPNSPDAELRFKEKRGDDWVANIDGSVDYGEPFKLEAEFREAPTETPVVVQLEWEGANDPFDVEVTPVNGAGTIFRSDQLTMVRESGQARLTRLATPDLAP